MNKTIPARLAGTTSGARVPRRPFALALLLAPIATFAQVELAPVTDATLADPPPGDWLMYSRSYDSQRMSPLADITRDNVRELELAWSRPMHPGTQENIPIVHDGVMFVANPGAIIQAIDGATGALLWEYRRELPADLGRHIRAIGRARTLAIYGTRIYYAAPDGYLVALDAATGDVDWEARVQDYTSETQHTTGPLVVGGRVLTGRNCGNTRAYCFIAAHDAATGEELWRFHTTAAPGEPGGDTWGDMPADARIASPWCLPGGVDLERGLDYWGIANPNPHTRIKRHAGNPFAVPLETPAELYSNSTLALDPATGELAWYYQHLPGDDWDSDYTHERILFRSVFDPDPAAVRWINPNVERGTARDMLVTVGEPGGLWVLDRASGEFLWATPFPFATPDFHIADIDVETGRTRISRDKVLTRDGEVHTTCFQNTRSYWPMAYDAKRNALYVPYHDACVTRTGNLALDNGHSRDSHLREGGDPAAFAGLARVDMATGRITRLHTQRNPGNGAILLTAGGLVFWGDMSGTFFALDADSGEILWDASVEGIIQTSTITYRAGGRQYVAILTGDGLSGTYGPLGIVPELKAARERNGIHVFALPRAAE
ncbi:MAG: PQQ-binding-like beta-propeller repeat protein [Woeseiaceae bacterium]|nr:PQQ-binding-like beta-propeller repeat protein [Woeseiaceae bacterium]